jgi:hypothetical protein
MYGKVLEAKMPNPDQIALWTILFKVVDFLFVQLGELLKERREKRRQKGKQKPRHRY